ncbi:hypothetical protein GPECTOR_210g416 [Gonium pectorale]|uniref:Uncharacterized protein n=1 Tax=Gonium pectorale TaxID=33097 RepID=A0A150FWT5_GONPE|nr:hypothetical protein GPECTOR_210g416 [Gonium pectorale]|eukprot:KXZ42073.1 hypothetical protein GPECTOR_210g416 [Gonium pectorale]
MLPELVALIANHLAPNFVACNVRVLDKATAACLSGSQHSTVHLSQPAPTAAFRLRWGAPGAMHGLSRRQRLRLLCLVAQSGDTANLHLAIGSSGLCLSSCPELLVAAAAAGQLAVCGWLRQQGCPWGKAAPEAAWALSKNLARMRSLRNLALRSFASDGVSVLAAAGSSGDQGLCEWLLAEGCPWDQAAVLAAACAGHVGLVEWLLAQRPELLTALEFVLRLAQAAAVGFELEALQHLFSAWRQRGIWVPHTWAMLGSLSSHTPDWRAKVEWLEGETSDRHHDSCDYAAACPDGLERIRYLRQRGHEVSKRTLAAAARAGNAELVAELIAEGAQVMDGRTWLAALDGGNVQVLWALAAANAGPRPPYALTVAAEGGHMPAVAWVVEQKPWERGFVPVTGIASSGSLTMLQYLQAQGFEVSALTVMAGAEAGSCPIVEWLAAGGLLAQAYDGAPYLHAGMYGDLATLRCLRRLGCPWPPFHKAVRLPGRLWASVRWNDPVPAGCTLDVLTWMLAAGCPVDWEAAVEAAARRPEDAAQAAAAAPEAPLAASDLLVVLPTFHGRIGLVEASRSWRRGVRTHVVVDDKVDLAALRAAGAAHNETFSATADFPGMPHVLRHVLAPVLAHKAVQGRYRWMLLGDDDTLWSVPAVLEMLHGGGGGGVHSGGGDSGSGSGDGGAPTRPPLLPSAEPIAISDFLVDCRQGSGRGHKRVLTQPLARDGRCLPCGPVIDQAPRSKGSRHSRRGRGQGRGADAVGSSAASSAASSASAPKSVTSTGACSCRLPRALAEGEPLRSTDCPPEGRTSFYGGAGAVLSVGLMERLAASEAALQEYYSVAFHRYSRYSDIILSEAIRRAGVGFTAPPAAAATAAVAASLSARPQQPAARGGATGAPADATGGCISVGSGNYTSDGGEGGSVRRFGTWSRFNDWATPTAVLGRHLQAAAREPAAFRSMVSAHVRQHDTDTEEYLRAVRQLGKLMARQVAVPEGGGDGGGGV